MALGIRRRRSRGRTAALPGQDRERDCPGPTLDDWRRVTAEAITDAFGDGLTALELRFSPQFITGMTGLDADDVIEAVSDAVSSAALPIEVGLIGIIVRDEGPDSAAAQVRRLLRHKSALVGVDLAGDEAGYPAALFAPAFRLAREAGLPATVHAGEAAGPRSVWDALRLGPRRIGHGVRSAEDPRLLEHLAASGVTLEVAITSNVQTGAAAAAPSTSSRPWRRQRPRRALHRQPCRERHPADPRVRDRRDLVDAAALDNIRRNALAARFPSLTACTGR